jgi:hypothetical protein
MIVTIWVKTYEYFDTVNDEIYEDGEYVDVEINDNIIYNLMAKQFNITEEQAYDIINELNISDETLQEYYKDKLEQLAQEIYCEEEE